MPASPSRTWYPPPAAFASASDIGARAKTPMLSGIVTGSVIGFAWVVGFFLYVLRRLRASRAARKAGYRSRHEMLVLPKKEQAFIIPPDPAVITGEHAPGEHVYVDEEANKGGKLRHALTLPFASSDREKQRLKEREEERVEREERARGWNEKGEGHKVHHAYSAPEPVEGREHVLSDDGGPTPTPSLAPSPVKDVSSSSTSFMSLGASDDLHGTENGNSNGGHDHSWSGGT